MLLGEAGLFQTSSARIGVEHLRRYLGPGKALCRRAWARKDPAIARHDCVLSCPRPVVWIDGIGL